MTPRRSRNPRPFLSLQNATFRLGDRLIFEDTNWTFHHNEQWAIVGPNSSGKSVLGDALRGALPLVQGEMRYHFRTPPGTSAEDSVGHVGFEDRKAEVQGSVVQSRWTSFEEEASLRVSEFLSYQRVMDVNPFEVTTRHRSARPGFEKRLARAIGLLRLGEFLPRKLLALSNGERQRVQLARALARPLRLLILDEPYVGLDWAMRHHFHGVLDRLLRTSLRVLLITTRAEDLPSRITHVLCVKQCQVVASGPRREILRNRKREPRERAKARPVMTPGLNPAADGKSILRGARGLETAGPSRSRNATEFVELRNVTVRYGEVTILRNLNWVVREGESWALLGPNGSGKTTLLSLILGDNPQVYQNEVFVFGRRRGEGQSVWELKRKIGWVSPELQLHFDDAISVFEVVASGFQETIGVFEPPTPRQSAAARRWMKRFELSEFAELPLFSLSAGLQRMALLARALVKGPRLLILDEPCQGLDEGHRDLIIKHVDACIRKRSVTAIFVTHRLEEIPPSIQRLLRLSRSRPPTTAKHAKHANI